jgi:serine/threonine-protein kinase
MIPEVQAVEAKPRLPRRFGRYTLFDAIGKGGMAEIFLARATTELGGARLCVVKQIIPAFAEHPQFAEMLIHEAKLAAKLSHANIVQVFDLGRADGELFIAMEYVEGFDLNALLRRCTEKKVPLPFEYALRIVCDVLRGLDYAHRREDDEGKPLGIVHRDVSPSNVLVSFEGEVKLCDFGIAHANDLVQPSAGQVDEAIKGKAGYMSPEHARGEAIDARADVFAAGILLWELVAGHRLYRSKSPVPLLEQAKKAEIPPLPERKLPNETRLREIAGKALAKDRDERFKSAAAMLREIESYIAEAKIVVSPLRLGDWVVEKFGMDVVSERRERERKVTENVPERKNGTPPPAAAVSISTSTSTPTATETPTPTPSPTPISTALAAAKTPTPPPAPAEPERASTADISGIDVSPPSNVVDSPPPASLAERPRSTKWIVVALVVLMSLAILWSLARR